MNKQRNKVASASYKENLEAKILVWKMNNLSVEGEIEADFGAVNCVQFSGDGEFLVGSCLDEEHTIMLIDLTSFKIVHTSKCGKHKVLSISFKSATEFISVGIKHFTFWTK